MNDPSDENSIKTLDTVNDFPHVGLMYFENSGENLLRYYLENIFKIQTQTNIKKEFLITASSNIFHQKFQDLNLSWIIASDYPSRSKFEYEQLEISMAVVLVRNPIEVIMSLILKNSFLLEEALNKADELIKQWKAFYKYWVHAPIPVYFVKYEELLEQPYNILKDLSRFMLGIKNVDETKLDFEIKKAGSLHIEEKYYAFDVSVKQSANLSDNTLTQFQEKFSLVNNLMKKFKYADDDEEEGFSEITNWINEFNNENLVKSVELHEMLANSVLTSTYYTIRIS